MLVYKNYTFLLFSINLFFTNFMSFYLTYFTLIIKNLSSKKLNYSINYMKEQFLLFEVKNVF